MLDSQNISIMHLQTNEEVEVFLISCLAEVRAAHIRSVNEAADQG